MFDRTLNPGQLEIVREIVDGNATGDIDTAVYTDVVDNYTFTRNADGSVTVDHSGFVEDAAAGDVEEGEWRRCRTAWTACSTSRDCASRMGTAGRSITTSTPCSTNLRPVSR